MKFFLDTANLEEIRQGVALGVIDGVTTNPTLIAKEKRPFREHILEICKIVKDGVVNAEVVSTDTAGVLCGGGGGAPRHPKNIIKISMNPPGGRGRSGVSKGRNRRQITLGFFS